MGGSALNLVENRRMDAAEYHLFSTNVLIRLKKIFDGRRVDLIPAYKNKLSFGDADYIVRSDDIKENVRDLIQNEFDPIQIVKNSNVWSFDIDNFQIDVILTRSDIYDSSLNYFALNDAGNLEGKIIHKLGCKHGHAGLSYVFRDGTYEIGEILLSRNIESILEFGGWEEVQIKKRLNGFDELEDIFEYISASRYFNPDIYLLDNLNHIARIRDRKRKTYQEFLKWCAANKHRLNHYPHDKNKSVYFERINRFFPHFQGELDKLNAKRELNKERHDKFNGGMIKREISLEGKDLGQFIISFKSQHKNFEDYLDNHDEAHIIKDVQQYHSANRKSAGN